MPELNKNVKCYYVALQKGRAGLNNNSFSGCMGIYFPENCKWMLNLDYIEVFIIGEKSPFLRFTVFEEFITL